jgi:hypothetical protein
MFLDALAEYLAPRYGEGGFGAKGQGHAVEKGQ